MYLLLHVRHKYCQPFNIHKIQFQKCKKNNHEHLARDFHLFGKNKSMKCIVISQKLLIHLFTNLPMFTMEKRISLPQIEIERQTERLGYVYKYSTFYVFFLVNASSVRSI